MMYSFSVTSQLIVFLQSIAFGLILGTARETIGFVFGVFGVKGKTGVIVSDIVFSLFSFFSSFCFVLAYNFGTFRLYIAIGVFFGVMTFIYAVGHVLKNVFEKLLFMIGRIRHIITAPFIRIFKKIYNICIKKLFKRIAKKKENVV